jgi:hypothetical protein
MATEKLKFKLELYATMWDRPPHAEILIGDKSHFRGDITDTEDKPTLVEFEHELTEGETATLIIDRSGKSKGQTVINENGDVLKDQLLHIKSIEIDEIDLGALVYEGVYTPDTQNHGPHNREKQEVRTESFKNVTSMGHDGTWRFTFTSPFYMWLLENLY